MGPILAIDYGEKRVGVAVSDPTGTFAFPRKAIVRTGGIPSLAEALRDVAVRDHVTELVVGLPLSLNGSEGPQAKHVREAAETIAQLLGLPLAFEDERLTSSLAGRFRESSVDPDSIAAAQILEGYLAKRKRAAP